MTINKAIEEVQKENPNLARQVAIDALLKEAEDCGDNSIYCFESSLTIFQNVASAASELMCCRDMIRDDGIANTPYDWARLMALDYSLGVAVEAYDMWCSQCARTMLNEEEVEEEMKKMEEGIRRCRAEHSRRANDG